MKDGGPAFPLSVATTAGEGHICSGDFAESSGMTLRDYFAAKAMQGLLSGRWGSISNQVGDVVKKSYEIADAMVAERDK